MAKFNVGDIVMCVNDQYTDGELVMYTTYQVEGHNGEGDIMLYGVVSSWSASRFVSVNNVPKSPIRTRREIVPGQWGNINVSCVVDDNVLINVRDDFGHVAFSAEQLREAAHLFNQIAEVLEENAG